MNYMSATVSLWVAFRTAALGNAPGVGPAGVGKPLEKPLSTAIPSQSAGARANDRRNGYNSTGSP